MNNNQDKDKIRFNKLYQLLGDDVNQIYNTKNNEGVVTNNNIVDNSIANVKKDIPLFTEVDNIFDNQNNNEYYQNLNAPINNYNNVSSIDNNLENIDYNANNSLEFDNNISNSNKLLNDTFNIEEKPNEIYIEPTKINIKEKLDSDINKLESNVVNNYNSDNINKFRNKTIIGNEEFSDGLDDEDGKNRIIDILTNKKFLLIVSLLAFLVVCVLVVKAFYFGKVVNIYNEYTTETEKESDSNTNVYGGEEIDSETLKKVAAENLINCIKASIDTKELPDSVNAVIKEINSYYNRSSDYFAFAYKDIFTGFTVTYNENGNVFAASTIKAPVNIYLYEMASEGKIDLDEEMTYTANYYNDGTGVLKNKSFNTNYTIRTLSEYAIRNSDNAAHNMLMDKYGKSNIKSFWQDKGTNIILTGNDNWGLINAHDALIYMKELYTFYINNLEYGNEVMNNFLNTKTKFITGKNDYKIANKSGWSGNSQHDVSIVFADNPYIIVALSNLGYNSNYMEYFNKVSDLTYKLHNEYWKYKMNMCNDIKLFQE